MINHFSTNARLFKEKYTAIRVSKRDEENAVNENYDNCYVLRPNRSMQKYYIPKHEQVVDYVTEHEIKNIFQVSSLPHAIVLRESVMEAFNS